MKMEKNEEDEVQKGIGKNIKREFMREHALKTRENGNGRKERES